MDMSIIAALIGFLGTIISAAIGAAVSLRQGLSPPARRPTIGFVTTVVIGAFLVGGVIAYVFYDGTHRRIQGMLPTTPGHQKVIYKEVGLGFLLPSHWTLNDAVKRIGGGELDLVRDTNPQTSKATQGIKIKFLNVLAPYVNNHQAEINNQLDILKGFDPNATVYDVTVGNITCKEFSYLFPIVDSKGSTVAQAKMIWAWITPHVKIQIGIWNELEGQARTEFDQEVRKIIDSIVLDQRKISQLSERLTSS